MKIICAVCNAPVQKITRWRNEGQRSTVFEVECHGDTERSELDDITVASAEVTGGQAFTTKRIGGKS